MGEGMMMGGKEEIRVGKMNTTRKRAEELGRKVWRWGRTRRGKERGREKSD